MREMHEAGIRFLCVGPAVDEKYGDRTARDEDGSVKGLSDEIAKLAKTEGGSPGPQEPESPAIPEIFQKSEYVLFVNSHSLYHNFWHAVCDSCLNFAG